MTDKPMKDKRVDVKIEEELKNEFDRICKEQSINKSDMIRRWIKDFVKENEGK